MGKTVSDKTVVTRVYTDEVRQYSSKASALLPGFKVMFGYQWANSDTYTRPLKGSSAGSGFRIQFGGQMVRTATNIPQYIKKKEDTKKYVVDSRKSFRWMFYHEMGHLLYTDMYDRSIIDYKVKEHRGFIHSVFNILEDIVIEKYCMSIDYPYTAKYMKFGTQRVFIPQCKDYKDNNDPASFLNYLLLRLRCTKAFTGVNKFWDDNKKDLAPMVKNILMEEDPTERVHLSLTLAVWIIKKSGWDFKPIEVPPGSVSGSMAGTPGAGAGGGSGTGGSTPSLSPKKSKAKSKGKGKGKKKEGEGEEKKEKPTHKATDTDGGGGSADDDTEADGGSHNNRGGDHAGDEEAPELKTKDELDDITDDDDEEIDDHYDPNNDLLLDHCDEVDDAFNEVLGEDGGNHEFVVAKNFYIPTETVKDAINKRLEEVSSLTNAVKAAFSVYKGRIRPKYNRGFYSGRLDVRKAMSNSLTKGCDVKLFEKKIANGIAPDLAVSILCDNSGSMGGNKSRVCTTAMLALAKACSLCNIPIEVSCFTENWSRNYTIRMKEFDDKFEDSKDFLGITDYDIYGHYIDDDDLRRLQFAGNEDEVNLYYIWKEFLRNKHKDKLLIVISDGETCGSSNTLRNLVKQIEASGISVLGLGIQSRAVENLYTNYKLFDSKESLDSLPEFLTSTLFKFAKGGK